MAIKLFDAELKVMDVLWSQGASTAKAIAEILGKQIGWSKTTTYTVIKRCIEKGAIKREDPNFVCHPMVTIDDAREYETDELISKMYNGSPDRLMASILGRGVLTKNEIERLKQMIHKMEAEGE